MLPVAVNGGCKVALLRGASPILLLQEPCDRVHALNLLSRREGTATTTQSLLYWHIYDIVLEVPSSTRS